MKSNKTTKADFELFKSECEYWIDRLSLREWEFNYLHKQSTDVESSLAWTRSQYGGRVVDIALATEFDENWTIDKESIAHCAFHEVCEILLAPLRDIAMDINGAEKTEQSAAIHAIIHRLEHSLWKPDYEARQ